MALSKTTFRIAAAVLISTLSASQQASTQGYKDQIYIGCTELANTLQGAPEGSLRGGVNASCQVSGQGLGGCGGQITTSVSKGTPGGGTCASAYVVQGTVNGVQCQSKVVSRPADGWNGSIHYAHFDSVVKDGDNITCSMGGS
jgi:hypothetical protein